MMNLSIIMFQINKMRREFILLFSVVLLLWGTSARILRKKVTMGQLKDNKIMFVTHFDFGVGENNITLKYRKLGVQNSQLTNIKVGLLLDQNYNQYKNAKTCRQKQQVYSQVQRIRFYDSVAGTQFIRVNQAVRQHLWFIFIFNCDPIQLKTDDGSQGLNFQISLFNNGSHFGEDQGMFWPYLILFILWIGILIKKLFMPMLKSAIKFNTDPVQMLLSSGYLILGLALFYKMINIITETYSGQKIVFFDILHGALKNLAQGFMLTLLIAIAWGWSIIHPKLSRKIILISAAVTIINIMNVGLWHYSQQTEDSYHQYQELPGVIAFILRLALAFVFVFGCISTSNQLVGKKKYFLDRYAKLGSLYLFSWPAAVVICEIFLPQYLHNEIITITEQYVHLITNAYICWIFAYPDSDYKKVNLKKEDEDALPEFVKNKHVKSHL